MAESLKDVREKFEPKTFVRVILDGQDVRIMGNFDVAKSVYEVREGVFDSFTYYFDHKKGWSLYGRLLGADLVATMLAMAR
jgi:hypothetical protein